MRLRRTNSDDLLQLKSLWALGFGDTQEEIDAFFSLAYPDALSCLQPATPCRSGLSAPMVSGRRRMSMR